jgi:hypothetical protein
MNNCTVGVHYVGPGIEGNDLAIITFDGDIDTLGGNQRGLITGPPGTVIVLHCHNAKFVDDEPLVWVSHEGKQPPFIEMRHESPIELKLIVGGLEEKELSKFLVHLEVDGERFTSKDPTIVSDPTNLPPSGGY